MKLMSFILNGAVITNEFLGVSSHSFRGAAARIKDVGAELEDKYTATPQWDGSYGLWQSADLSVGSWSVSTNHTTIAANDDSSKLEDILLKVATASATASFFGTFYTIYRNCRADVREKAEDEKKAGEQHEFAYYLNEALGLSLDVNAAKWRQFFNMAELIETWILAQLERSDIPFNEVEAKEVAELIAAAMKATPASRVLFGLSKTCYQWKMKSFWIPQNWLSYLSAHAIPATGQGLMDELRRILHTPLETKPTEAVQFTAALNPGWMLDPKLAGRYFLFKHHQQWVIHQCNTLLEEPDGPRTIVIRSPNDSPGFGRSKIAAVGFNKLRIASKTWVPCGSKEALTESLVRIAYQWAQGQERNVTSWSRQALVEKAKEVLRGRAVIYFVNVRDVQILIDFGLIDEQYCSTTPNQKMVFVATSHTTLKPSTPLSPHITLEIQSIGYHQAADYLKAPHRNQQRSYELWRCTEGVPTSLVLAGGALQNSPATTTDMFLNMVRANLNPQQTDDDETEEVPARAKVLMPAYSTLGAFVIAAADIFARSEHRHYQLMQAYCFFDDLQVPKEWLEALIVQLGLHEANHGVAAITYADHIKVVEQWHFRMPSPNDFLILRPEVMRSVSQMLLGRHPDVQALEALYQLVVLINRKSEEIYHDYTADKALAHLRYCLAIKRWVRKFHKFFLDDYERRLQWINFIYYTGWWTTDSGDIAGAYELWTLARHQTSRDPHQYLARQFPDRVFTEEENQKDYLLWATIKGVTALSKMSLGSFGASEDRYLDLIKNLEDKHKTTQAEDGSDTEAGCCYRDWLAFYYERYCSLMILLGDYDRANTFHHKAIVYANAIVENIQEGQVGTSEKQRLLLRLKRHLGVIQLSRGEDQIAQQLLNPPQGVSTRTTERKDILYMQALQFLYAGNTREAFVKLKSILGDYSDARTRAIYGTLLLLYKDNPELMRQINIPNARAAYEFQFKAILSEPGGARGQLIPFTRGMLSADGSIPSFMMPEIVYILSDFKYACIHLEPWVFAQFHTSPSEVGKDLWRYYLRIMMRYKDYEQDSSSAEAGILLGIIMHLINLIDKIKVSGDIGAELSYLEELLKEACGCVSNLEVLAHVERSVLVASKPVAQLASTPLPKRQRSKSLLIQTGAANALSVQRLHMTSMLSIRASTQLSELMQLDCFQSFDLPEWLVNWWFGYTEREHPCDYWFAWVQQCIEMEQNADGIATASVTTELSLAYACLALHIAKRKIPYYKELAIEIANHIDDQSVIDHVVNKIQSTFSGSSALSAVSASDPSGPLPLSESRKGLPKKILHMRSGGVSWFANSSSLLPDDRFNMPTTGAGHAKSISRLRQDSSSGSSSPAHQQRSTPRAVTVGAPSPAASASEE